MTAPRRARLCWSLIATREWICVVLIRQLIRTCPISWLNTCRSAARNRCGCEKPVKGAQKKTNKKIENILPYSQAGDAIARAHCFYPWALSGRDRDGVAGAMLTERYPIRVPLSSSSTYPSHSLDPPESHQRVVTVRPNTHTPPPPGSTRTTWQP